MRPHPSRRLRASPAGSPARRLRPRCAGPRLPFGAGALRARVGRAAVAAPGGGPVPRGHRRRNARTAGSRSHSRRRVALGGGRPGGREARRRRGAKSRPPPETTGAPASSPPPGTRAPPRSPRKAPPMPPALRLRWGSARSRPATASPSARSSPACTTTSRFPGGSCRGFRLGAYRAHRRPRRRRFGNLLPTDRLSSPAIPDAWGTPALRLAEPSRYAQLGGFACETRLSLRTPLDPATAGR